MEVEFFTFKDEWFDYERFALKPLRKYRKLLSNGSFVESKHDGTMGKHAAKFDRYLESAADPDPEDRQGPGFNSTYYDQEDNNG